ncbi:AarF/UbiB family protein [Tardiphaga sp.]|uniref:ABC1 kinase family protein n=1 Tax=Tardiphaga sp. TaxID=1926292 RepID=UPI002610ACF4|nr:AarF/UbiB family protein [Tardiphaga sp.]
MSTFLADAVRSWVVLWVLLTFNIAPLLRTTLGLAARGLPVPVRIRLAIERLGTTYLKLGQFMAMRFDLLPREICDELQRLFENVPPLPFDTVRAVVEAELGAPLADLFSGFDPQPIGAASIAQVHSARNHRGERLAVKIQRPDIDRVFEADMRILGRLARAVDWFGWFPSLVLNDMVAEFATFTRRELDFVLEGRTAERLRSYATTAETVPRIYWTMTTRKVLTMEFIEGLSIAEAGRRLQRGEAATIHTALPHFFLDEALHNLAFASLHQFFGTGFFHADPHPGNILLLADSRVAFIDFGIFGMLSREKREWLAGYTENLAVGNIDTAYRYYAKLSTPTGRTDLEAFRRETKAVLSEWYQSSLRANTALSERHIGKVIGDITDILRRHSVRVDLDTLLFWRAAIALDSSALSLSADFDLMREMRYYFRQQHPSPVDRLMAVATSAARTADVRQAVTNVPDACDKAVSMLVAGQDAGAVAIQESTPHRRTVNNYARATILAALSITTCPLALQFQNETMRAAAWVVLMLVPFSAVLIAKPWQS